MDEQSRQEEQRRLESRMSRIGHKILVLSGKGGVGKSTVAVNLAVALAAAGRRVGLLDVDIHGPSVPKMLGIEAMPLHGTGHSISPLQIGDNLFVMSIGLLLRSGDEAVIWRGPMKMGVIKQFLADVEWGELDYLVIDSPPGTGDEPLSVAQLIPDADGAVVVTTPQDVALADVRRCITFCRQLNLPVIGVVENMSGFVCPHCGKTTDLFKRGGGEAMAAEMGVPFLGRVPFEPEVVRAADGGEPYVIGHPETETGKVFAALAAPLLGLAGRKAPERPSACGSCSACADGSGTKFVAVPVDAGVVSGHFGHAEKFVVYEIDCGTNAIARQRELSPPEHAPGAIPDWLAGEKVQLVIAGGMGAKAKERFGSAGIDVIVGAPAEEPGRVVRAWLDGTLDAGEDSCSHDAGGGGGGCGGGQGACGH
ncbi:MAG: iron-sulfur cluster carrier protein MrpORP [Candidatus Krumholzibacteria bacterium]|nr:iron-sulfur cluster carrier protein MrpORP [Candidatus Krumholzibacteria bacterium]